jgi:outer membrane immunogenic protein
MRFQVAFAFAAAVSAVAVSGAALAADVAKPKAPAPVIVAKPVLLFNGHYFGVVGAYGWGTTSADAIHPGNAFSAPDIRSKGWLGGLTLGSNFQGDHGVFGIEADISGGRINGSGDWAEDDSTNPWSSSTNAFGTLRLRYGHPIGKVMPFVSAGAAYQNTRVVWDYENGEVDPDRKFALSQWGWALSAGIEVAHSPKVSWKIEYLYAGFGSHTEHDALVSDEGNRGVIYKNNLQMIRFGVNFKLGG